MWVRDMSVLLTAVLFTEKGAINNTSSDQSWGQNITLFSPTVIFHCIKKAYLNSTAWTEQAKQFSDNML